MAGHLETQMLETRHKKMMGRITRPICLALLFPFLLEVVREGEMLLRLSFQEPKQ
jgi:hypothetical protein